MKSVRHCNAGEATKVQEGGSLKFSGQRQSIRRRAAARRREIAIYDGQTFRGRIVMLSGKRFEAFDPTGSLLGEFSTVSAAYDACSETAR
jgi:hypothetical protein